MCVFSLLQFLFSIVSTLIITYIMHRSNSSLYIPLKVDHRQGKLSISWHRNTLDCSHDGTRPQWNTDTAKTDTKESKHR